MRVKIIAGGIYGAEGEVPVGTILTVNREPIDWAGRYEVLSTDDEDGKAAIVNPAFDAAQGKTGSGEKTGDDGKQTEAPAFVPPVGPFTVKEGAPGWWVIHDGQDQVVGKNLRQAAIAGFDELSDEDKLAFATDHAKAAFDAAQGKD